MFPYYHVQDSTMYLWWWFTVSVSYTLSLLPLLPIDSVDRIRLGRMCRIRLTSLPVLLYSIGMCSAYMARASLWSTYVFYIIWYFYTLWMLMRLCTCPFLWSRFHCYEHPPCRSVLYTDSLTLTFICLVLLEYAILLWHSCRILLKFYMSVFPFAHYLLSFMVL